MCINTTEVGLSNVKSIYCFRAMKDRKQEQKRKVHSLSLWSAGLLLLSTTCGCSILRDPSGIVVYDPVKGKVVTEIRDQGMFREMLLNTWPEWKYFYTMERPDHEERLIVRKRDVSGKILEQWDFPYFVESYGERFVRVSRNGDQFLFYRGTSRAGPADELYVYNKNTKQTACVASNIMFGWGDMTRIGAMIWRSEKEIMMVIESLQVRYDIGPHNIFVRHAPPEFVQDGYIVPRLLWVDVKRGVVREEKLTYDWNIDYKLSPSGKYIAKVKYFEDGYVEILETDTMRPVRKVVPPTNVDIINVGWADKRRLIIYGLVDDGSETDVIYVYNIQTDQMDLAGSCRMSDFFVGAIGSYIIYGSDGGIFTIGKKFWIKNYVTKEKRVIRRIIQHVCGICENQKLVMEVGF